MGGWVSGRVMDKGRKGVWVWKGRMGMWDWWVYNGSKGKCEE